MFFSGAAMAQTDNTNVNANLNDLEQTQIQNVEQDQVTIVDIENPPSETNNVGSSRNDNASSSSSKSSSNNSMANVGNTSINVEGDDFPASSAIAPSINPTSPCMGSSSAGGQGMSFGVSVGSSWRDKECEKREAFRMGMESGHPEITALALEVYRSLEAVQEALKPEQPGEQARARPSTGSTYDNALASARQSRP